MREIHAPFELPTHGFPEFTRHNALAFSLLVPKEGNGGLLFAYPRAGLVWAKPAHFFVSGAVWGKYPITDNPAMSDFCLWLLNHSYV